MSYLMVKCIDSFTVVNPQAGHCRPHGDMGQRCGAVTFKRSERNATQVCMLALFLLTSLRD
ncbi:hypothetical protein INR49_004061 [Caranx melampygus]|nr:hypothetical protein INR49_004061 [Caranx melampygus]